MPTFSAPDGTQLAYRVSGDGAPVICLPGGPTDSAYLGNLGDLHQHRQLVCPDPRGTGQSAIPEDPTSYRCDRLVDDVEALREDLGLPQMDLLAHCAGANVAAQYVAQYPENVGKLTLITPSTRAVGITITAETRRETAQLRKNEPWFPVAFAALEAIAADEATDDSWEAVAPFFCGRWDAAAQDLHAASQPSNKEAVSLFGSDGAFDPETTRAALAAYEAPVLLLAGEFDLNSPPRSTAEFAGLFPNAELVVQRGAGHYPWLDDADQFVAATSAFLG